MRTIGLSLAFCFIGWSATAQNKEQIKNLTAFAEAYGYVKYFHPSDEANDLDWNAFAVYGADQILQASNDKEVIAKLNGLYQPLAPTARFYLEEDKTPYQVENLNPQKQNVSEVTYWQHKGVSFGVKEKGSSPYKSRRINIDKEIDESARFGNVMYKIDANPYQGLKFRYTAAVKMAESSEGNGQLWFRVDKKDGKLGFFENMRERPIKSNEWKEYTIEGTIDQDAEAMNLGAFLLAKGELYFDEAELEVYQNESWQKVELPDPGFEKGKVKSKLKEGFWLGKGLGYKFSSTKEIAFEGKSSIKINYE